MPTTDTPNRYFYKAAQKALKDRMGWEKKMAFGQLQRFQQDRGRINTQPWPRASNVRWPLSDMIIEQWKPFFFRLIYTSENIAFFKALVAKNIPFAAGCAHYFDFVIKEKTDFEREVQLSIDSMLQNGECYIKTTWDAENETPSFQDIDPLFIIAPSTCTNLDEAQWIVHVIQWDKADLERKFKDLSPDQLDRLSQSGRPEMRQENDQANMAEDEYFREGITRTGNEQRPVTWEVHYKDTEGKRRLRTISPDDPDIDFGDDRAYPYDHCDKMRCWMIKQHRREITGKNLHSSRGIPEVVMDGEHALTSGWRLIQNRISLGANPIWSAPNGIPGSSGNIKFMPGQIVPFALQRADNGTQNPELENELMRIRDLYERRAGSPDFGVSKNRNEGGSGKRTAREISYIQTIQGMQVDLNAGNWKRFVRENLKQGWALTCQFKPKSLLYYVHQDMRNLPEEALNNDYLITVSGSMDNLNREAMIQKAQILWQGSQNNPYAVPGEAWKNLVESAYPGQVQRFYREPAEKQMDAKVKAAMDLTVIMATGFPVPLKPTDDFYTQAITALEFLQSKQVKGEGMTPQTVMLVSQYIQANRAALQQMNPDAYKRLTEILNQYDIMHKAGQRVGRPPPEISHVERIANRNGQQNVVDRQAKSDNLLGT